MQMKEILPLLVHWACRAGTKHFALPRRTLFQFRCPHAQQAGQVVAMDPLSLSMWFFLALSLQIIKKPLAYHPIPRINRYSPVPFNLCHNT